MKDLHRSCQPEALDELGNFVKFNASKSHSCCLSNKKHSNHILMLMNGHALNPNYSFSLAGVDISIDLVWLRHVADLAVVAGKKLQFLCTQVFFSNQLYWDQIWLGLKCWSQVWDATAPTTLVLLDSVHKRITRNCHLVAMSPIANCFIDILVDYIPLFFSLQCHGLFSQLEKFGKLWHPVSLLSSIAHLEHHQNDVIVPF